MNETTQIIKHVTIPAVDEHAGILSTTVRLVWVCPVCGGPRGEPTDGVSWDGSRRLYCHTWFNPCGHIDKYPDVRTEAKTNDLNVIDTPDNGDPITDDDRETLRLIDDARALYTRQMFTDRAELVTIAADKGHDAQAFEAAYIQAGGEIEGDDETVTPRGCECSTCGTRYEVPPYTVCPRCSPVSGITPNDETPVFKVGDKVTNTQRPDSGVATIRQRFSGKWARSQVWYEITYPGGQIESIDGKHLTPYIDPRDAEIARLKQELLGLEMAYDIEMAHANDLGKAYEDLSKHTGIIDQREREAAVNEGYEAGQQEARALIDAIRKITVDHLGPMEALTKLYELKRLAGK